MKVSVIIPYYGNRRKQFERSLPFLENQTYSDYEIILVDDGAIGGLPELGEKFKCVKLRNNSAHERSANMSMRRGFYESTGDFIIITHPEIIIPYNAIETMICVGNMDRRNGPIQYHLTTEQSNHLDTFSEWKTDLSVIKTISGFWDTKTPWGYPNTKTHEYRNHFSFSGCTRERFSEYLVPATELWGMEDAWVHVRELAAGEPSVPVNIEIYHQQHRTDEIEPVSNESVRVRRIRESLI